jgi:hypothetical protein
VSNPFDDEFEPSDGARRYLRWAQQYGATTLGDAFDLLEQFELGNDVPEVLREDDSVEVVRSELQDGLDIAGPDVTLAALV